MTKTHLMLFALLVGGATILGCGGGGSGTGGAGGDGGTGGTGNTAGTGMGATGGAGATGGGGTGGAPCTDPTTQCPDPGNECVVATCAAGACATSNVAAGTPTAAGQV